MEPRGSIPACAAGGEVGNEGGTPGRNSGAEREKCAWGGGLRLREAGNRRRCLREKRCNRSFRWVTSAAGVAAAAQGPSIGERTVRRRQALAEASLCGPPHAGAFAWNRRQLQIRREERGHE